MDKPKNAEKEITQLLTELRILGFAAAKEIARLRGWTSGVMDCPLCQQDLRFSVAPSSGHMRATCETMNCIDMME